MEEALELPIGTKGSGGASGTISGVREQGNIILELIPRSVGIDVFAEAIRQEMQYFTEREGVTTYITTWARHPSVVSAFTRLAKEKKMPARLAWFLWVKHHDLGSLEGTGDEYLWNAGVEYEAAVLEATEAQSLDPSLRGTEIGRAVTYASTLPLKDPRLEKVRADSINGALIVRPGTPEREDIMKWLRLGVRVVDVHCYSDAAVALFIGILDQLQQETGWSVEKIKAMRNFYLSHNMLVRPEQIPVMAKWGMVPGPSSRTWYDLPLLKMAYGEEIKKYVLPIKSLMDAGVRVASNLDYSPTIGPDGEGMWDMLEFWVDREYGGEVWNKAEAVDRWTALKTMTINGAWVALRENELGSLEVGKFADLVVLDKDYFTIPAKEIGTITPALVMVGGKVAYQSDKF